MISRDRVGQRKEPTKNEASILFCQKFIELMNFPFKFSSDLQTHLKPLEGTYDDFQSTNLQRKLVFVR